MKQLLKETMNLKQQRKAYGGLGRNKRKHERINLKSEN